MIRKRACLVALLLAASCSEVRQDQFILRSKPEKDGSHDLKLVEHERLPGKSIIRVEVMRKGPSVADSMFIVCGMALLTKQRGFRYFKKARESKLSADRWEYEIAFHRESPNDEEAMDADQFLAVCR